MSSLSVSRRTFLKNVVQAGAAVTMLSAPLLRARESGAGSASVMTSRSAPAASAPDPDEVIWACLLHISYNMWEEYIAPERERRGYRPFLRLEQDLWDDVLQKMAAERMNMAVLDLGDGIQYESHPEIPVKGAWPRGKLRSELKKMRDMGLEPIPKLNFSATHDAWLGPYARMLSTDQYYQVCRDLITEVIELFDQPRFFHLGMDEETARHQRLHKYVVIRQQDLWWHDFFILVDAVEAGGVRPWIWSDYLWNHPEEFFGNMPKSVMQSNWYYDEEFNTAVDYVRAYHQLEEHGYDQIPTGSNYYNRPNFGLTVEYCPELISPAHLYGFLQTIWKPPTNEYRSEYMDGIELAGAARRAFEK
ncbi:MAG TPA: Tat pathway signal protein [bacterium]|nr:Tat pathway signal protein [bacterium]